MTLSKKIVVVEDDEDTCDIIRYILSDEGFELHTTSKGIEAERLISDRDPDLIFLDLKLGDIEGWKVCKAIKANPATENIPIVIISAGGNKAIDIAKLSGANDCLLKPFDIGDLINIAHKYIYK